MTPRRTRHLFVQQAEGKRLFEMDLRAENSEPSHGYVAEASYFETVNSVESWMSRMLSWISGSSNDSKGTVALLPPFDEQGNDVHKYLAAGDVPLLDNIDDPLGAIRLAAGTIVPLLPRSDGDEVVLRDVWVDGTVPWRVTDMIDFGLELAGHAPVAVCCAQCPLVIAEPRNIDVRPFLSSLHEDAKQVCNVANLDLPNKEVPMIELRVGDVVDVLGVVWDPSRCKSRFDVSGRGTPFRASPFELLKLVLGDERGTRMVLRKR